MTSTVTAAKTFLEPGERVVRWINNLTLTDEFRGQRMRLRPWQERILRVLFGSLKADGTRQYRKAFIFLARKQAKTQLVACVALYLLLGEKTTGQETAVGASDREQAGILFDKVVEMIEADPYLKKQVRIYYQKQRIRCLKTGNILKVLSGEGRRGHGGNPSVAIIDELHAQRDRRLLDAMTSGSATRKAPMVILISTAGEDHAGLCREELKYAQGVQAGTIDDPEYLPILYHAEPTDDWTDERTWHKAMPALGDFVNLDVIRGEFKRARKMPSEEHKFKSYYLNLFVGAATKWLNSLAWERCGQLALSWPMLKGRTCYGGLDMSSTSDTTCLALVFPLPDGTYAVRCWFWMPRAYAEQRQHQDGVRFLDWASRGWLTLTDGPAIDYDVVEAKVKSVAAEVNLRDLRIDPHNAFQIAGRLLKAGLPVQMMRQGPPSMTAPIKFLEVLLATERLRHGNDPVLTWQMGNVCAKYAEYDTLAFSKKQSADKIDGPVSLAMGIAGAIVEVPEARAEMLKLGQAGRVG